MNTPDPELHGRQAVAQHFFHLADTKNQFAIAAQWVANTASISNIIGMMALRRAKNFSNAVRREVCIDSVNS
jgi:hypothetical protein